jgi:hypothetical protein
LSKLLLLKLTLAPALVATASLLGRRYGRPVSGALIGFPIVAGPVLYFYAAEQGPDFAARAAISTLEAMLSLCAFCLAYAWRGAASRPVFDPDLGQDTGGASAWSCLVAGYVAFSASTVALNYVEGGLVKSTLWAVCGLFLTSRSLPRFEENSTPVGPGPWDLPARLASTAALVLTLTYLADRLGPRLSGLLTPFPVATTVLVVFAHLEGGIAAASSVLKGFLPGLYGFTAFMALFAACVPRLGLVPAFGIGLAGVTLTQTLLIRRMRQDPTKL